METSSERRVALVTGAGSGIGQATALTFANKGFHVVVNDVNEARSERVARRIREAGGESLAVAGDVSLATDVERVMSETESTYGRLDVACNNAGVEGERAPTADCTEDNWDRVIDTNLKGVWLSMKYEIPLMREAGGGSIVNIASIAGPVGYENLPAYTASKHGINGLTKTTALEYADEGIRVNSICPGGVETPMIDHLEDDQRDQLEDVHPLGRVGEPEEIAQAAYWLCSDAASFVTGHVMNVDGGFTAR